VPGQLNVATSLFTKDQSSAGRREEEHSLLMMGIEARFIRSQTLTW